MRTVQKLAIVESLDAMDQVQMDKVLGYIKSLLKEERATVKGSLKQRAMEEIRQALRKDGFSLSP